MKIIKDEWKLIKNVTAEIRIWERISLYKNKITYVIQTSKTDSPPDSHQLNAKETCRRYNSAYNFSTLEKAEYYINFLNDPFYEEE